MKLSLVQLCCSRRRRRLGRCGRRRRRPGGGRRGSGCATVQAPTTWDRLARPAGEGLWSTQANHTSANWPRHSLHYQYCQSICTLPTPNPFVSVNLWVSGRSCPPKCAPATALRRPRHAPLPSCSLHGTTPHCPLNSTLPTPSLAPSFSSAGRFSHRPTLAGPPPEASIVVGQI